MRHSRSLLRRSFLRTAAKGGLRLSHKGRGNARSRVYKFEFQTAQTVIASGSEAIHASQKVSLHTAQGASRTWCAHHDEIIPGIKPTSP